MLTTRMASILVHPRVHQATLRDSQTQLGPLRGTLRLPAPSFLDVNSCLGWTPPLRYRWQMVRPGSTTPKTGLAWPQASGPVCTAVPHPLIWKGEP